MPATYEVIATATLSSTVDNLTFTSIPGTYTDLLITCSGSLNTLTNFMCLTINGDNSGLYGTQEVRGTGTATQAEGRTNAVYSYGVIWGTTNSLALWQIFNYANTNMFKSILHRGGSVANDIVALTSTWRNTSAVTTVRIDSGGSRLFSIGTMVTLYGIKAA